MNRLDAELETLANFSDAPAPAVTRIVFSERDLEARAWIKGLFAEAGLEVRVDAVGNTFARWIGSDPALPAVASGSHIDAIPHSGKYDGTVGVLGCLEAIRSLREASFKPRRSIELVLFTSEEPTRFGIGCLGSRLMSGSLDASAGETLHDNEGKTLNIVREEAGFPGALESVKMEPGFYSAFVELHIEQGPMLERRNIPLGVVTAIAAPASLRIFVEGQGGHAGAVLMPDRHDAFLASAEAALALESLARSTGAIDTVATTGICEVFPGAVNSIPSRAHLTADIRDINGERRDGMIARFEQACREIAQRRGVTIRIETVNRDAPAACDLKVVAALSKAAHTAGLEMDLMVSRAYHDSLFMSRICPTSMLFIPCRKGISHTPEEHASSEAIAQGTRVLSEALAALSLE
jgi:ureidoglycolate amidohydrolase